MNFSVELPLDCSVSFGQCSVNILKELHKRSLQPNIFLINNAANLAPFDGKLSQDFLAWLNSCINKAAKQYKRTDPTFRLWHIQQSWSMLSEKGSNLLTFHETDNLTDYETNILNQQNKVLVCSNFSKEVFESFGVAKPVQYCPLGFDSDSFYRTNKKYIEGKITFSIMGKLEPCRKAHKKTIQAWLKKYGNSNKYVLNCALYNPFLKPEEFNAVLMDIFGQTRWYNVNINPLMVSNDLFNDYLNSNNIVLAMSGGEAWSLGEFQSISLGKFCVGLAASGHLGWMNNQNTVLVKPNSKYPANDGKFFITGAPYNQGNFFSYNEDEFIAACEQAIKLYESNPVNQAGLETAKEFTWSKTTDIILESLKQ